MIAPPGPPLTDGLYKAPTVVNPLATQVQQLAANFAGAHSSPMQFLQNYVPPAPNVPAGTYMGAYAAQGLRTTDPHAAAQLWESRHPAQVHAGNIPGWVTQGMMQPLQNVANGSTPNPGGVIHGFGPGGAVTGHPVGSTNPVDDRLNEVINHYRQSNGLGAHHPEEIHARVSKLAHELMHGRNNRVKQALRRIRPPAPPVTSPPPPGPVGGPFVAS